MKRKQRGITMLGFLITLCLVIFFAYCAMKIVPMKRMGAAEEVVRAVGVHGREAVSKREE